MARKIKSEDEVIVIAGDDKGKRGKVIEVLGSDRLRVSGVNIRRKTRKPNPQRGIEGGIISVEGPIHRSNVATFDQQAGKATRVGFKTTKDGNKIRYLKASGEVIEG